MGDVFQKSTNAEKDFRVQEVKELIVNGATRAEIVRHCSKYEISSRQVDTYMAHAWEEINEAMAPSRKQWAAKTIKRLENFINRMREKGNPKAEVVAMDMLAKILGLYQIDVFHHVGDKRPDITDDDLRGTITSEEARVH